MLTSGLGSRVVWNITAMRVVKVRWTNVNPIAGLKMAEEPLKVVFEGHFAVHPIRGGKETGETIVGKSAIVTGVSNGTYRQLTMTLIPQGVEVRDGFAVEGIVPIGALIFH